MIASNAVDPYHPTQRICPRNETTAMMELKEKPATQSMIPPYAMTGELAVAFDCEHFLGPSGPLPMIGVAHFSFADLTPDLLAATSPSMILLPLFAASYDAVAAVERLQELGYTGKLTILAPELPKPRLVERELRNLGPGTRLTLISP